MHDLAVLHIDGGENGRVVGDGSRETTFRQEPDVGEGSVGEGESARSAYGARDICHAVVYDAFFNVGGVFVRCGAGCFSTTPLIDGDIDQDGAFFHVLEIAVAD